MPTYSGNTVTVNSASENIDISLNQGNAIIVSVEAAAFSGAVDFQSTIDGETYTNHPYISYHAASPTRSVAQLSSPTTYAAYVILPPVTQARIVVTYSSGSLEVIWREVDYKTSVDDSGTTYTGGDGLTLTGTDFDLDTALTTVTSIYAENLIMGEDSQTAIDFGTPDEIDFKINNTTELTLDATALYPTGNAGLDLGTSVLEFKDAFFDGTVTSDAFAGPLTGNVTGNADTVTTNANLTGDVTSSGSNATSIASDVIVNADIKSDAAIAISKLATITLATNTTGDYVQNITGGVGIDSNGATSGENIAHSLTLDLSELTDTAIANGDYIVFTDATDSHASVKGDLADVATLFAGAGMTATNSVMNVIAGTGIDVGADAVSVDVSDFMTNGANNYVVTATGTDAMNAEAQLTFDGDVLAITGTGTAKANKDILTITNDVNAADMDGTETSILFNQWYYDGSSPAVADAGRISIGTEQDWTSTGSTQDSYMAFETAIDGTVTERVRITSAGDVTVANDLSLNTDSAVFNMGDGSDFTITHDGTTGATLAGNPITITAGGASSWTTSAGALTVTSAAAATWSTAAGALTLDGTGGLVLKEGGSAIISISDARAITTANTASIALDASGVVELNSTAGALSIGNDNIDQAVNIATGGTRTLNIGIDDGTDVSTINVNASLRLGGTRPADDEPLTNNTGYGVIVLFDAGAAVAIGDAVSIHTDGRVIKTVADATGTLSGPCIGIATTAAGSADDDVYVMIQGVFRHDDWAFGTKGQAAYIEEADPGDLSTTAPNDDGDYVQRVGVAVTDDVLLVMPSIDVIEHA